MLHALHDDLTRDGVVLVLVHAQSSLLADFERHRLTAVSGARQVFDTLRQALAAIRGPRARPGSPV